MTTPLATSQVVRGPSCGHALHAPCLISLVGYNSVSCPQCRASLVPPCLAHLAPALAGASSRAGANRPAAALVPQAPASASVPGVEPRASGTLTAADWEWGASDDSDADADDAEAGRAPGWLRGSRGEPVSAETGALVMALRMRAQNVSMLRAICAKVSLAVFLTLVGLVMFLLIGSFTRPDPHGHN
jgi:hypothetical protein